MATDGLQARVLGRLTIVVAGSEIALPHSSVLRGLLGVLLLARGEPLAVERLTRLVWADRAETTHRPAVQVAVSRLRKWLNRPGSPVAGRIKIDYADGYLLEAPGMRVDLSRCLDLIDDARSVTDPAARSRKLASALGLRTGAILDGMTRLDRDDVLVRGPEETLRQAGLDLAQSALTAGVPQRAVGALTRMCDELPFDEPIHAALIDVLAAAGRSAEALTVHGRLTARIADELGVGPSDEVRQAHLRLITADQAAPYGGAGAERPLERLRPAQLPPDIGDFTGRSGEAGRLTAHLLQEGDAQSQVVPITVVAGMGGVGKTTLAVHIAHQVRRSFPDGQLFVDLHGGSDAPADPASVLGRFLSAFGLSGPGVPSSLEERTALYRSRLADRRVLVLLDNAASERQVRPLLPSVPGAAVIITSRNRLIGLEGADLLNLDVLPPEQASDLLAGLIGEERVNAEADTAVEIARLCGHIPLAMRVAAARLRGRPDWPLTHLADVLREGRSRLDELTVGDLEVRAGFELSYRSLPAPARRAFRLLGTLYAPDYPSWVIGALLNVAPTDAQRHIEVLVDAHLLNVDGVDGTGHLRYRMHDLIRLYARERAEREEPDSERLAAVRRALGAWLWLAERAADHIPGPCWAVLHGTAPRWELPAEHAERLLSDPMEWFTAERWALLAQVRQACDLRLDEFAWDLAASTEKYCDVRGMYSEWLEMHERTIRLCRESGNKLGEAVILRGLLDVTTWVSPAGSGPAAVTIRESAEHMLSLFSELEEPVGMADAMVAAVWGLMASGADAQALATAERARQISQAAGYLGGQARALHVMAAVHGESNPGAGIAYLERALAIANELGNPRFTTTILQFLGAGHVLRGDIEDGRDLLMQSILRARELGDRYLETFSLLYLAKSLAAIGDSQARPTAERALELSRQNGFQHHLADALSVLGELSLATGEPTAAVEFLKESVRIWRTRDWLPFLSRTLRTLGDAHAAANDLSSARTTWTEARDLFLKADREADVRSIDERIGASGAAS